MATTRARPRLGHPPRRPLGVPDSTRDRLLDYALIWAALHGRREVVEFLLAKHPDLAFTEPFFNSTAHGAARHGRHEEIAALLDRGGLSRRARLDCQPVPSGFEQTVRVQLRWRDIDLLGHLNQSVYHELLEEGRVALMAEIMRRVGDDHVHGGFVLAHVDLDHHAEVRKDHEEVDVVVRLAHVGTSSIVLEHEVRLLDGTLAASGKSVLVGWDPSSERQAGAERARARRALLNRRLSGAARRPRSRARWGPRANGRRPPSMGRPAHARTAAACARTASWVAPSPP